MKIKNAAGEILKAGCIVVDDNKVLLVTDKEQSVWSYPKGHVEVGETLEQAALREALEEKGYIVKILNQLNDLTYTHGHTGELIRVAMFLAAPIERISEHNEEISAWKDIADAKSLIPENLKPYLKNLS